MKNQFKLLLDEDFKKTFSQCRECKCKKDRLTFSKMGLRTFSKFGFTRAESEFCGIPVSLVMLFGNLLGCDPTFGFVKFGLN